MTVSPKLGASDTRTDRGMVVRRVCSGKCSRTSSATWADSRVRPSNIVNRMVETASVGLRCVLINSTLRSNWDKPSSA